jgi:mannose-6-phosphate isomerase-like protein (cupin superfamily)
MTAKRRVAAKALAGRAHRVYRLAPDLLLVFKPRGHREDSHEHGRAQRLRVLLGALVVRMGRRTRTLRAGRAPLTVGAGQRHQTEANEATWLLVEWLAAEPRRARAAAGAGQRRRSA